jgi:hypothetical protein
MNQKFPILESRKFLSARDADLPIDGRGTRAPGKHSR